jgi:mono/diheme cytochrome c family protein
MRASLRKVGWDHPSASGRVLPAVLLVLLATAAACRGDRGKPASTGETSATPTSDSTAIAAARDTSSAAPAKSDTGDRAATAPQPSDTTRKRPQSAGPRPAKRVATASPKRVATASTDTGAMGQDTSVKAKPESTTAPSDTGKAKADTGAAAPAQAEAPLRDAYHQAPRDTVSATVYDGWKQFNLNCARCHGEDVLGTSIAPHLIVSLRPDGPINTKELFMSTVCAGRPAKGMPAWCSLGLGMDKIQNIYSYVKGRSDGKISPGRPAVREGT